MEDSYDDYDKEKLVNGAPDSAKLEVYKILLKQGEKSVCKIKCEDGGIGTGFFFLIPFPDKIRRLRALATNNHILEESDIKIGKKIEFSINNEKKKFNIVIDNSRKVFTNKKYDITFIEIKKKDGIKDDSFLEIDDEIFEENIKDIFKDKSIYLLHYPNGKNAEASEGLIKSISIDKYNIKHGCNTTLGSSGSPILILDNNKLIGIHKGGKKDENCNKGTLLTLPIEEFNKKFINNHVIEEENNNLNIKNNENIYNKNFQVIEDNKKIINLSNHNINKNINIIGNDINDNESEDNDFFLLDNKKDESNKKADNLINIHNNPNIKNNANNNPNINYVLNNHVNNLHNIPNIYNNVYNNHNINNNANNNINNNILKIIEHHLKINKTLKSANKIIDEIIIVYKKPTSFNNPHKKYLYDQTISEDKIFGEKFVENNIHNCKIIYKGKEYRLCSYLKEVTNESIEREFSIKLKGLSKITNASSMFMGCISLFSIEGISEWDTKKVVNMEAMFLMCKTIKNLPDI